MSDEMPWRIGRPSVVSSLVIETDFGGGCIEVNVHVQNRMLVHGRSGEAACLRICVKGEDCVC